MTRTILIALACALGAVSMAQAQSGGSSGGGSSSSSGGSTGSSMGGTATMPGGVGNAGTLGTSSGTAPGGTSGGGAIVTPLTQPSIDTNQAQQPGVGVNRGQSNNGSVSPPSK